MTYQLGRTLGAQSRVFPRGASTNKRTIHRLVPSPLTAPNRPQYLTNQRRWLPPNASDTSGSSSTSTGDVTPESTPVPAAALESQSQGDDELASTAPSAASPAGTDQPDPASDGAVHKAFDLLRNAFFFPATVFLTILNWIRSFPGWAQAQNIKRLREISNEDPTNPDKHAALLQALNKVSPKEVIARVQSREFATNSSVAVEYLKALVATGQISSYTSPDPTIPPADSRSLPELLQELQQQAAGISPEDPPGSSSRRPLHITMAGTLPTAAAPIRSWPVRLVSTVFWSLVLLGVIAFAYIIGSGLVRRVTAPVSSVSAVSIASQGGGMAGVEPKEYKKEELPEKSVKSFKDVKGCDEAKEELQEVVEFLRDPQKFMRLGAKLPKGVLLTGPPGTGKTLLAKAVAGEAGVPFFYRAGSEFEELYVGVGARRMRALFTAAKKRAPCIVFIDEIDAIGGNRKQWDNHTRKTLNQLLVEMDGFEGNEGVIVMAATNLAETLDPALKRPGRFDRQVAVPLPDVRGRQELLEYYLGDKPVSQDVDREHFARQSAGFSGADLSNLVNEAALLAAKEGRDQVTSRMMEYAFDKICMGVERKSVRRSEEALKRTAYHEAGHAIVALHTTGAKPIHKATIVPRGHALGMVVQVGSGDEFSINREQMLAEMRVCMGGKVAEELIFGRDKVTSGCTNDLKQATRLARHMVTECGQSDNIGPVYIPDGDRGVSEDLRQRVDAEVRTLLVEAQEHVVGLLGEKLKELHTLAAALIEFETLSASEIKAALRGELPARPSGGVEVVDSGVEGGVLGVAGEA